MSVSAIEGTEGELLVRAAAGDARAARWLIDEVGPAVFGFVLARVGGNRVAADDIVQDAFMEALRSAGTFRGDSSLTTWMCTLARRRVARHFEAERRATAASELETPGPAVEIERVVGERDAVIRALSRLPVIHRQVLVLKYLDDLPVAAIAQEIGRTTVQVQSLLQRARAGLRHELGGQGD